MKAPRTVHFFLFLFLFYAAIFTIHAVAIKNTVFGDGLYYYSWLRSLVIDGDINFTNEYAHYRVTQPSTAVDLPANKYAIGPAMAWSPFFVSTHMIARENGFSFPYQFAVGAASVGFVLVGLLVLYLVLEELFGKRVALATVATIAFATQLFYYGAIDTVSSHSISFFAAALLLFSVIFKKSFLVGLSFGLLVATRPQDALFALLLLPYIKRLSLWQIIVGSVFFIGPQVYSWIALYGRIWPHPYFASGEHFVFSPKILEVLFNPTNGLILYTPVLLLAIFGLIRIKHSTLSRFVPAIWTIIGLQLLIVSMWHVWWQGASFGGRMFISSLPILSLGIAFVYRNILQKKLGELIVWGGIVAPASMVNALFILSFLLAY